ncbi:MAG TPA: glycosyltransferase family 4 protein [Candidatus Kryptobacter bacterium]|nr:glycosyltransferase family 4 protein [Candidatus Kryptobacter bacterium]
MKSIYLYSPYWRNFGGGERYMLYLASALSKLPETEVTVLSEFPEITKGRLAEFFQMDLSGVNYRTFGGGSRSLRKIIDGVDVFIPLSNFKMVRAVPKHYVQTLQVPYARITPLTISGRIIKGEVKEGVKDLFRIQLLSHTRKESRLTLTNSKFVHDNLLRSFKVGSSVLYPPIGDFLTEGITKRRTILSVGRIFRGLYNDKRYDVLTDTFRKLSRIMPDWQYHIVGSALSDKKSRGFLNQLKEENRNHPVFFHVNVSHESLKKLYNEATIYWHGAGFGVDEVKHPEATEHFGMSVLEAMTAGCIPVVVDKGGLKEIVTHRKNGFLWQTIDDLADYTLRVANMSPQDLSELQENARLRYSDFSVSNFEKRVAEIFLHLLL